MSEIPFLFDSYPQDFRKLGWFKNPYCVAFVTWAFSRCSRDARTICHDGKLIDLDPYEFVFGHEICTQETGLTRGQIRHQQQQLLHANYITKTTSKTTNKYSVYKWVTSAFSKSNNQQNNQPTTSKQPANNHNQDIQSSRCTEPPPQTPPISAKEEEEDFKIIEKIVEDSIRLGWPFSKAGIFDVFTKTSGFALYEALQKYKRRKKGMAELRYPDNWLLSEAKKEHNYQTRKNQGNT